MFVICWRVFFWPGDLAAQQARQNECLLADLFARAGRGVFSLGIASHPAKKKKLQPNNNHGGLQFLLFFSWKVFLGWWATIYQWVFWDGPRAAPWACPATAHQHAPDQLICCTRAFSSREPQSNSLQKKKYTLEIGTDMSLQTLQQALKVGSKHFPCRVHFLGGHINSRIVEKIYYLLHPCCMSLMDKVGAVYPNCHRHGNGHSKLHIATVAQDTFETGYNYCIPRSKLLAPAPNLSPTTQQSMLGHWKTGGPMNNTNAKLDVA